MALYVVKKYIFILCFICTVFLNYSNVLGQTSLSDPLVEEYIQRANNFRDDFLPDSAIMYYQKAARIYKTQEQTKSYYLTQVKVAEQLTYLKKYSQARKLLHQHLVAIAPLFMPEVESLYYHTLGEVAYIEKRFKKALEWAKTAQKYSTKLSLAQVDNQRLMAACKTRMAYPQEGLEMTKNCLKQLKQLPQNQIAKEIKLKLLLLQSRLYIDQRAFDKALDICYEAEQFLKQFPQKRRFSDYLLSIYTRQAISYKNQHKLEQSILKYRQNIELSEAVFGYDYEKVAFAHKLLGRALLSQGLARGDAQILDAALFHLKKSADLHQQQKQVNKSELGEVYVSIGGVYQGKKRYKLAIRFYQQAYDLFKDIYGSLNPYLVPLYSRWSGLYNHLKQYDEELKLLQKMLVANSHQHRSLNIYTTPKIGDYYNLGYQVLGLINKAIVFRNRSQSILDLKQSLRHSLIADSVIKYHYRSVFRKNDRLLVANYIKALNSGRSGKNVLHTCNSLYQLTGQKAYIDTAFYFIERGNASYLMSMLAESNAKKFADIPPKLLKIEAGLRKNVTKYQSLLVSKPGQQTRDSLVKFNLRYETLIRQLEQQYPKYAQLKLDTKPVGIKQIKAYLKSTEALLGYSLSYGNVNHVLLITKKQTRLIPLSFIKNLDEYTQAYYQQLQSEARLQRFAKASHDLYQVLFLPLKQYLKGIKKLIVIAPSLESTPLEALVTKQPSELLTSDFAKLDYLSNHFQISYHYSATLWYQSQMEKTKFKPNQLHLAAFAPFSGGKGHIFKTTRGTGLNLPESKIEVLSIFNLCKANKLSAKVNLASSATKEQFIQTSKNAYIIHIASHSEANRKNAGLAKIRFSGCEVGQGLSGCLLASEIYNLELNTDLLVLSSCESGVGKLVEGEGVMSLARSFLYAGARNIVFSLWEVDDAYTRELMVTFYGQFLGKKKTSYSKALQLAQQKLKQQGVHPKHWAGIVMIGK